MVEPSLGNTLTFVKERMDESEEEEEEEEAEGEYMKKDVY